MMLVLIVMAGLCAADVGPMQCMWLSRRAVAGSVTDLMEKT